jgi:hypothetical protein
MGCRRARAEADAARPAVGLHLLRLQAGFANDVATFTARSQLPGYLYIKLGRPSRLGRTPAPQLVVCTMGSKLMEESVMNGEKFARRATRAWRLRRLRHIRSSCDHLEPALLAAARRSRSRASARSQRYCGLRLRRRLQRLCHFSQHASLAPFCCNLKSCASARLQRCCGLRPQHLWRRGLRPHWRLRRLSAQ